MHGSFPVVYGAAMLLPPTMRTLIDDPQYRAYVRRVPHLPANVDHGTPWAVYAQTQTRWKGGRFPTYADAWRVVVKAIRTPTVRDVALVCRPITFDPPGVWEPYRVRVRKPSGVVIETRQRFVPTLAIEWPYEWCGRCRRPTTYEKYEKHHALRLLSMSQEPRCFYCGLRKAYDDV